MSNKGFKSLSELVGSDPGPIQDLARRATAQLDLADLLRSAVDPDCAAHLTGCNLRPGGELVVMADGPEWASRLRFESEQLLKKCREQHPSATRVRIRVAGPL